MDNKDSNNKNIISKILGITFLILALGLISIYLINGNNKKIEEQNRYLQDTNKNLKKSNEEKEKVIERLDKKNVNSEEEKVRKVGKEFVELLYISNPKTDDKKKYDNAKKIMTEELADKYFDKKRRSPIIYDSKIQDVNIFNDNYSPAKKNYKLFVTFRQLIKDTDGSIVSQREIGCELKLKQTKNGWVVNDFKQIGNTEIKDGNKS